MTDSYSMPVHKVVAGGKFLPISVEIFGAGNRFDDFNILRNIVNMDGKSKDYNTRSGAIVLDRLSPMTSQA